MPPKAKPETPETTPVVASDPDGVTITPPDPDAPLPLDETPDVPEVDAPLSLDETPDVPEVDDQAPVTMADVAALNGIGIAPDASDVRTVKRSDVPFISAGMASDLEQQGWCLDPRTGQKIVKE